MVGVEGTGAVQGGNMSDYIDRQAALDMVRGLEERYVNNLPPMVDKVDVCNALDTLPSADVVEVVRCENCQYWTNNYVTLGECKLWRTVRNRKDYCSEGRIENG